MFRRAAQRCCGRCGSFARTAGGWRGWGRLCRGGRASGDARADWSGAPPLASVAPDRPEARARERRTSMNLARPGPAGSPHVVRSAGPGDSPSACVRTWCGYVPTPDADGVGLRDVELGAVGGEPDPLGPFMSAPRPSRLCQCSGGERRRSARWTWPRSGPTTCVPCRRPGARSGHRRSHSVRCRSVQSGQQREIRGIWPSRRLPHGERDPAAFSHAGEYSESGWRCAHTLVSTPPPRALVGIPFARPSILARPDSRGREGDVDAPSVQPPMWRPESLAKARGAVRAGAREPRIESGSVTTPDEVTAAPDAVFHRHLSHG